MNMQKAKCKLRKGQKPGTQWFFAFCIFHF
jgi:hypothetical protein